MTTSSKRGGGLTRRELIGTAAVIGAAGTLMPAPAKATLPARVEFVIRNAAHVLTMDPALGDLERADIHVRDGGIVAQSAATWRRQVRRSSTAAP
jgi:hypothetical protein